MDKNLYTTYPYTHHITRTLIWNILCKSANKIMEGIYEEYAQEVTKVDPEAGIVIYRGRTDYLPTANSGKLLKLTPELKQGIVAYRAEIDKAEAKYIAPVELLVNDLLLPIVNPRVLLAILPPLHHEAILDLLYISTGRKLSATGSLIKWVNLDAPIWDNRISELEIKHTKAIEIINEQAVLALLI